MASNLRQAVDEAPMESYYCQTENMGIYDKSSRLDLWMPSWPTLACHSCTGWKFFYNAVILVLYNATQLQVMYAYFKLWRLPPLRRPSLPNLCQICKLTSDECHGIYGEGPRRRLKIWPKSATFLCCGPGPQRRDKIKAWRREFWGSHLTQTGAGAWGVVWV